ncbi:MAG: hypothetical protein PUF49_08530 [Firmicutes bacterium]|nr:hypothetical protein [Bacillota bacterium]
MEQSMCHFLNINQTDFYHLYDDIYNSVDKEPWLFISNYIDEYWNGESFDKVQFYHLTRRLDGSDIMECTNIRELLVTENPFSAFLKTHQIYFEINDSGTLDQFFHKRKLVLDSIGNVSNSNLISRLERDYCVNGFAVRNLLEKENCGYYNSLIGCPELITVLDDSLKFNNGLIYDYIEHSKPIVLNIMSQLIKL